MFSEQNAEAILAKLCELVPVCTIEQVWLDPAARARTGIGVAAFGEYQRVFGERRTAGSPQGSVVDGLDQLEILLEHGDLLIHPRSTALISGLETYMRANVGGEWMGFPQANQSPAEDMVDAIRYLIRGVMPEGRRPQPKLTYIHPSKVY
jgi:hypothetical protein